MEESREDDLLKADDQGRNAEPEVVVSDLCITAEMTAGIEEVEYQLPRVSVQIKMKMKAAITYSLNKVGEDDQFEADQFC